jgi:hypothetical protein
MSCTTTEEVDDAPSPSPPPIEGLTLEFRDSVTYKKWRSDILEKKPDATTHEIDTAIWWYLCRPDMFECEAGKELLASLEGRRRRGANEIQAVVEEEEEEDAGVESRSEHEHVPIVEFSQ